MLSISGLCKQFSGGVSALQDIDLRLDAGEFIAILGPSGCGKSTLLRIAAGLMAPSRGKVIWDAPPAPGAIGVVFQEPTLMPWATACRNVEAPLRIVGMAADARRERALAALQLVGLQDFADAYPRTLSGGMKMRVAIARALVTKPQLLLLDEPFAALDEITRQQLNDDLLDICGKAQLGVLFVTHSTTEAVYLSDRVLVMCARPGAIIREIKIAVPASRTESFRHSAMFAKQCGELSMILRENVRPV